MTEIAFISGAAKRVGADIARRLHKTGANVVLHYRTSAEEAKALCDELNQVRDNTAVCMHADLTDTGRLPSMMREASEVWGRLDVLINNASLFYPTPVDLTTEAHWHELIDSNLKAPFFLCQAAQPFLKKQLGCIVNIIDIHAERPLKGHSVYSITKAGLAALTRSLAKEFAPDIRVNGVAPGAIMWPESEVTDANKTKILERIALNRTGAPDDIARAVLYFIREAQYVTGQILAVDGGRTLFS